ncbi:MAG: pitrilysin family protein [Candidatus Omnitrophota bacterium]|nr:pitrilysin family protein [Candidatus Omnitrophota bacterium]MDZ4241320.1 pitrilysin family protein [Candidatus Omnitrophota bacterium]
MYHRTDLENGLRVVTHSVPDRQSVAIGIIVGAGGRYEEKANKGVAHFLEHMVFKGSRKYSCKQIKESVEGVGGALNAFTTEEQTCFYAKIPAKHLSLTFDVLADMAFFPSLAEKDVVKEKGVILEEIKMYHDLPQYYVHDLLDELMWPDHPLGISLVGTQESVGGLSAAALKTFHADNFRAGNVVISACGHLRHDAFVRLVRQKLGKISSGTGPDFLEAAASQDHPKARFFRKDTEQMHLALGMPGMDNQDPERYALSLLNIILGGNMSSRLFNEIREKRGLAYSISSSTKYLYDTGALVVRAGVDNAKIVDTVDVVLRELVKIRRNGVGAGEFARARDYFIGQVTLGLEETMDHMLWIGESTMIYDRIRTLKELIALIRKVKPGDIRAVTRKIFRDDRYSMALIGPITDEQEKKMRGLLSIP